MTPLSIGKAHLIMSFFCLHTFMYYIYLIVCIFIYQIHKP